MQLIFSVRALTSGQQALRAFLITLEVVGANIRSNESDWEGPLLHLIFLAYLQPDKKRDLFRSLNHFSRISEILLAFFFLNNFPVDESSESKITKKFGNFF